jgi:CheY-like chemotaxis protein
MDSLALENKRIFIVEDDVMNLAIIGRVLTHQKASVFQNYNSIGIVIHVIQNLPIDLILLDLMLRRGMSGYDVVKEFKTNPRTARIPVVAVSSLDPETAIPLAKQAGFDGFISKPIDSMTFASDLADVLHGKPRWVTSR